MHYFKGKSFFSPGYRFLGNLLPQHKGNGTMENILHEGETDAGKRHFWRVVFCIGM